MSGRPSSEACRGPLGAWTISWTACKLAKPAAVTKNVKTCPIAFALLAALAAAASAEEPADHIERANLLRKLNEDAPPTGAASRAELPAARLETQQQTASERLQAERFQDGQWRQLLESQRATAHRETLAPPARGPALTFERDQRARDLSIQIQRQDLEVRQNIRR